MNQYHVKIPSIANIELEEISRYIDIDNPQASGPFVKGLRRFILKRLSFMPLSGRIVDHEVRSIPYKRYNIFYTVDENQRVVTVIHVFAGGRDWENIIRPN